MRESQRPRTRLALPRDFAVGVAQESMASARVASAALRICTASRPLATRAAAVAAASASCFAATACSQPPAFAETNSAGVVTMDRQAMEENIGANLLSTRARALSIRELREGSGEMAMPGTWVSVHYTIRLVGDGTVIEATKTSGMKDRDYGTPLTFELGNLGDDQVLRALHAVVLDMRVGGMRRVRTSLAEPSFGYLEPPLVSVWKGKKLTEITLQGDWLMDVVISLEAVATQRPATRVQSFLRGVLPESLAALVPGGAPAPQGSSPSAAG